MKLMQVKYCCVITDVTELSYSLLITLNSYDPIARWFMGGFNTEGLVFCSLYSVVTFYEMMQIHPKAEKLMYKVD